MNLETWFVNQADIVKIEDDKFERMNVFAPGGSISHYFLPTYYNLRKIYGSEYSIKSVDMCKGFSSFYRDYNEYFENHNIDYFAWIDYFTTYYVVSERWDKSGRKEVHSVWSTKTVNDALDETISLMAVRVDDGDNWEILIHRNFEIPMEKASMNDYLGPVSID